MKKEDIYLYDWQRILFGDLPGEFYLELVLRVSFVFILLICSMRAMGKRMAAQLSRNEMAALVSLAAAIGLPIQSPDRGMLPAMVVAFVVVLIQRFIALRAYRNQQTEEYAQGNISLLIEAGVIDRKEMLKVRLTEDRLMAQLRSHGICHLGEVKRLFLEVDGGFTMIKADKPLPGLSVLPAFDRDFLTRQAKREEMVCCNCGQLSCGQAGIVCSNCGQDNFTGAIF